jgi:hypothetical protein
MLTHLVLFKPRPDLSAGDRDGLATSFAHAVRSISTVRRVVVGRRLVHGAGYEQSAADADVLVAIDFDDLAGLQTYLQHPAHQELGARFNRSLQSSLIYDFEVGGLDDMTRLF